jgi:hypothetical protein
LKWCYLMIFLTFLLKKMTVWIQIDAANHISL